MADKSKSKAAARGKAKAAKFADAKAAKSAEAASATSKTATAKSAGKAAKAPAGKAKAKAGKAAESSAAAKKPKPEAVGETYYVYTEVLPIEIRDTPPIGETRFVEFSSFDDARDHLLEHLIELIEHHERVLHAVRRAASFADYLEQHGQFRAP